MKGRNYFLQIAAVALSKLGDRLANAQTTLPWLLAALDAPAALFGFLVPLREAGSMLPQIFLAPLFNRFRRRKWFWVGGSLLQGLCVLAMAGAFLLEGPLAGGLAVLALLALFSLARSFCSLSFKDVLGKTVPKRRRGRLIGLAAGAAGLCALAAGIALYIIGERDDDPLFLQGLLAVAAALWLLAALLYAGIREPAGESEGRTDLMRGAWRGLGLLRRAELRNLVLARTFLLFPVLTAPWYVLLAERAGSGLPMLGWFIIANGLAASLSAPLWGRLADRSSRRCMMAAGLSACLLGIAVFALLGPGGAALPAWTYPLAFFLLGIGHSGIRAGRKTYVVDLAEGAQRTRYVAVGNTVVGILLLCSGLLGLLARVLPVEGLILLFSLLGLGGVMAAARLRELTLEPDRRL